MFIFDEKNEVIATITVELEFKAFRYEECDCRVVQVQKQNPPHQST